MVLLETRPYINPAVLDVLNEIVNNTSINNTRHCKLKDNNNITLNQLDKANRIEINNTKTKLNIKTKDM